MGSTALYPPERFFKILTSFSSSLKAPKSSDELLASEKIINLIHEDLNESLDSNPISITPFSENPTSMLSKNWSEYKEANTSKITDLFTG